jgi:hypothetical protein
VLQNEVCEWPCIFLSKYFLSEIFLWIFNVSCASCQGRRRGNINTWTSVMHLICQPYRTNNQSVTAPLMAAVVLCSTRNCHLYPTWMDSVRDEKVACLLAYLFTLSWFCLSMYSQYTNIMLLCWYKPLILMSYAHWWQHCEVYREQIYCDVEIYLSELLRKRVGCYFPLNHSAPCLRSNEVFDFV